jgi:GT2 family glycosyltransferase
MIYICIPVFNRVAYTRKCIQSIHKQSFSEYSIIICDDGSTDSTSDLISAEFPDVIVIKGDGNLWWSGATNKCIEYVFNIASAEDFVFTLNNDTELASDTLKILVDFSKSNPESIVACGNYFNNEKNRLEATAFIARGNWPFALYHGLLFPWGQDADQLEQKIYRVSSVSGKGVLIPVYVFKKVGLYNSEKLPHYHGDTEFIRRASDSGYKVFLNLNAIIYTDQNASGIGQVNSRISFMEFIHSFGSLRSENYFKSLYNRSRLIYHKKWFIFLVFNLISIWVRFLIRYFGSFGKRTSQPANGLKR